MKNALAIGVGLFSMGLATAAMAETPVLSGDNFNLLSAAAITAPEASAEKAAAPANVGGAAFREGSWVFQAYGLATVSGSNGDIYSGKIGGGYHFLTDGFSFNVELTGAFMSADDRPPSAGGTLTGYDSGAGGLDLVLRYHFLRRQDFSIYVELGGGFLISEFEFPANGTHFNFTPTAGMGFTYRVYENVRLMAGARWYHLSNAGIDGDDRNPSVDAAAVYAGIMVPF